MTPLIKWPGGKRQLLAEIRSRMPDSFHTYYEPFFGGGALAFDLDPDRLVINDMNRSLVNLYRVVRDAPRELALVLCYMEQEYNDLPSMDAKAAYYRQSRDRYNELLSANGMIELKVVDEAALLVFLNKTCFNGMYRVNRKGAFNVPFGKKDHVKLCSRENMGDVSVLLGRATILCGDFESAVSGAVHGDFVFFDSPYYATFDTYQSGGFAVPDHERLAQTFRMLDARGVRCMLTNSDTDFIRDLYAGYTIDRVSVRRSVNRDANGRTGTEVIIRNYA